MTYGDAAKRLVSPGEMNPFVLAGFSVNDAALQITSWLEITR
jgi:hypothetical protein